MNKKQQYIFLFSVLGVVFVGFTLMVIFDQGSNSGNTSSNVVLSGDTAYMASDIIAGTTKELHEEMTKYMINKNYEAVDRMIARGEAFVIKEGSSVTVVDRGLVTSLVEVNATGKRGYVPSEVLKK